MSDLGAFGGPVSAALEAELRTAVRRHGIVVWLDLDAHYSSFVDRLAALAEAGSLPYAVRRFRGSHLALMMALEGLAGRAETAPLVIHLPGFNEDTVKETPLYELYAAGVRFRKALDTLVTEAAAGRVAPDSVTAFTEQPGLSLENADTWLAGVLSGVLAAELAAELATEHQGGDGGLAAQLRGMRPTAVLDDLLAGGLELSGLEQPGAEDSLWRQWTAWIALPATWRQTTLPAASRRAEDVAFAVASWALCVEYVDDLKRQPVSPLLAGAGALAGGVIDTARGLAQHLRQHHPGFYQRLAEETEALLDDEVAVAKAEDLGQIDTFRFEENVVLGAALEALEQGRWDAAAEWASRRIEPTPETASFWLRQEPTRQSAWRLVQAAAALGQAIARAGERLPSREHLDAAVEAYREQGAAVDQAHRHLEQRRVTLLDPQLPAFEALRARLDQMRRRWRQWADAWARDWSALCRQHGFLPTVALQQRTLFEEVVKPLVTTASTTAYFVLDAFRYEMGEELYRQLADTPATQVQLKPRLAELPTVTEVGMNVLAPVSQNGRLSSALPPGGRKILGFSAGEFRVHNAETRRRAMHDRVGGKACPSLTLEEVVRRDSASLKRSIAQARLVLVRSREADQAGENDLGPVAFEHVIQKVRAAWRLLWDAGVRSFIFTADHGFLLLDESAGSALVHGRKIDPQRRHVFSPLAVDHDGEVRVPFSDLGYEGAQGHVIFPETTAVFDTGGRSMSFVHGGNSLQERVIPVLTVVHRAAAGGSTSRYAIAAAAREGVAGMHCLRVTVEAQAQSTLDFGSPREIELAVRVPEHAGAQVELCQVRGRATLHGGVIRATVGEPFELFFRLAGGSEARVQVELHHPSADAEVTPCQPASRFAVRAIRLLSTAQATPTLAAAESSAGWLEQLPAGGVRQVFEHLAAHGTVTEGEAAEMLGGARGLRRFARQFEHHAQQAPFDVRIDVVAGVKRYVREGGGG